MKTIYLEDVQKDVIKKLEEQNKEMLDIMIECYWYVSERGDNLVDEIQTIIEKITGKTIDEALKK